MAHWGTSLSDEAHQLRYLSRSGKEQLLSFAGRADLKIGASPECDLVLDGPGVAPQHCRIEARKGRLLLFDRGSSAGTLINDQRCSEPTTLREGDRITIGLHLLEVLPGRAHLDEDAIAEHLNFAPPGWSSGEATRQMNFMRLLGQDAAAWEARQRPSRLLLRGNRLERAASLERRLPHLQTWLEASAARRRRMQGLRWWLAGLLPGLLVGLVVIWPILFNINDQHARREPSTSAAKPPPAQGPSVATPPVSCTVYEIQPEERETLHDVAADAGVDVLRLARENNLDLSTSPPLGPVKTCGTRPPVQRVPHAHRVEASESWESLALRYQLPVDRLRRYNPNIRRELRAGDAIELMVDPDLIGTRKLRPELEIPSGAQSVNRPQDGEIRRAILLQPTDLFDTRCPRHAYGASSAVGALTRAIRRLREHYNYHGQIIIGDLSKEDGGEFGDHLSHKSGRDIDIWLPIKSGAYRQERDCRNCQTDWCKVQEKEIDWDATLLLIRALHDTGQVQQIFLKFPSRIRSQVRKTPAAEAVAEVVNMDNHRHHLHVRFRCGDEDTACRN